MPKRASVDISNLERRFSALRAGVLEALTSLMQEMAPEAELLARDLVNQQIYETPPRGYERTRFLLQSIYAVANRDGNARWSIIVGAVGGAGGRSYALYNERGTYDGRVSLDEILRLSRAFPREVILLEFGRVDKGLEPRPFTIPAVVMVHNELVRGRVLDVIRAVDERTRGDARG